MEAKVGDLIAAMQYGSSAKTADSGAVPVLRMGNIVNGRLDLSNLKFLPAAHPEFPELLLRPGDALFNRTNSAELVGKTAVYLGAPDPCSFASYLLRLRFKAYEPHLFAFFMNSHHGRAWVATVAQQQVGQANVSGGRLRELEVPVPPIAEQRRIVAKLEDLLARSRRAEAALDAIPPLLDRLRQSVLASAFRGDLTADWREKNPDVEPAEKLLARIRIERRKKWEEAELAKMKANGKAPADDRWKAKYVEPEPVDASGLPELPEGWCWASVEELSTRVVDGVHKKPSYVSQGIPFLTVKNLTAGSGISFDDVNYVSQSDHNEFIQRTHPEQGDILVSKDGTLGVARLVRTERVFSIFVSLALIKPVLVGMGEYLERALQSPHFQERFKRTGSGIQHIHLIDLRAAAIPIAPLREQCEVLMRANAMLDRLEPFQDSLTIAVETRETLDRAILSKAFRGELVPQDPNDEPAEVMLARLKAEAATTAEARPAPRRRKTAPA